MTITRREPTFDTVSKVYDTINELFTDEQLFYEVDRLDNRIENLRDVPHSINNRNKAHTINKDTGTWGVYLDKSTNGLLAKYVVSVRDKGKVYRFRTLQEAIRKRDEIWQS